MGNITFVSEKTSSDRISTCLFQHVCLLHDNAPAHTFEIVKQFLKLEKVTVLLHLAYSPDLAPPTTTLRFFSFSKNWKKKVLVVDITQGKPLAQPSASVSEVYLNQTVMTHFRNGLTDWSYVRISNGWEYYEGMLR